MPPKRSGWSIGREQVARLMRTAGICGVRRGRTPITTRKGRQADTRPDLVERQFTADRPNQLWVADMTYIPTWAGFLYLAVVLDAFSRKVVGWAMGEEMTANLVLAALNMALHTRNPESVIHHSDQGSQYTSLAFGQRCREMGVRPSMGTVGDAYDNAMAESFFATLECELLDRRSWRTKAEARTALFTWIEGWYNPRRLHSSLGYCSPMKYEEKYGANNDRATEHGLPTAAVGSSQAPTAAVDNSAPSATRPQSTYKSGNAVQTSGATSQELLFVRLER